MPLVRVYLEASFPFEIQIISRLDFVDAVFKVCDIQMPSKSDAITRDLSDSDSSSSSKSDSDNSSSAKSLSATIATQTTGWKLEDSNQVWFPHISENCYFDKFM